MFDIFVTMARNADYVRTCTLPAYSHVIDSNHFNDNSHLHDYGRVQEAPPVIRRREKNNKDNSGNRRSRPASWFVSHFSFDKLFNRGNDWLDEYKYTMHDRLLWVTKWKQPYQFVLCDSTFVLCDSTFSETRIAVSCIFVIETWNFPCWFMSDLDLWDNVPGMIWQLFSYNC